VHLEEPLLEERLERELRRIEDDADRLGVAPPVYPTSVSTTPGIFRMMSSIPQKQPPARIAVSNEVLHAGFSPAAGSAQELAALALACWALSRKSGRYSA
jgi:hypothetical protein